MIGVGKIQLTSLTGDITLSAQYTHYSLGQHVLKNLEINAEVSNFDLQSFLTGCQGPDFCYYHIYHRNANVKSWVKLSETLHSKNTGKFFENALQYAKTSSNSIKSYLLGYLTHYSMDSCVHPYVFHYCYSSQYHLLLESGMDVCLMRHEGFNPHNTPLHIILGHPSKQSKREIGVFWSTMLDDVYGVKLSAKELSVAIGDIRKVFRLCLSKFGFKKNILSLIAKRMKLYDHLIALFYAYDNCKEEDYLNETHQIWTAPYDGSIKSNESFYDIFEKAKDRATTCVKAAIDFWSDTISLNVAMSNIGNLSMTSGQDSQLDLDLTAHVSKRFYPLPGHENEKEGFLWN